MVLNRERVLVRRAYAVALGVGVALGGEPPEGWYQAMADNTADADRAAYKAAVRRAWQEARATARRGGYHG